jgi:hypothetical protein
MNLNCSKAYAHCNKQLNQARVVAQDFKCFSCTAPPNQRSQTQASFSFGRIRVQGFFVHQNKKKTSHDVQPGGNYFEWHLVYPNFVNLTTGDAKIVTPTWVVELFLPACLQHVCSENLELATAVWRQI